MTDAEHKKIDDSLAQLQRGLTIRWAVVIVVLIIIAAWNAKIAIDQGHTADRALQNTFRNHQLAQANHDLVLQVQRQRYLATLENCRDSNARNRKTVRRIKDDIDQEVERHQIPAKDAKRQFDQTKLIINDLAPLHKDCKARALRIVSGKS